VEVEDEAEEDLQAHFDACFRAIEDGRERGGGRALPGRYTSLAAEAPMPLRSAGYLP